MRLFTGIALPESTVTRISRLLDALRPTAHLSWTSAYNLHITTKFIGEWSEPRLSEMEAALRTLTARAPLQLEVSGIFWLPNPHSPRILFAGIKAGEELAQLARDTEEAVAALGVARESRAYKPHLTLARVRDAATPLSPLRQAIASMESQDFGSFEAPAFALFESRSGPAGTIYTQLSEFRFQTE